MSASNLQHELGKRQPFDSQEQEAFLNIIRTASVLSTDFQRLFRQHKLSEATYNALRILRGAASDPAGGAKTTRTCSEIGEQLVAQVPDVTRLVDRLVDMGMAERVRCDKDRRVVHVRITAKGLEALGRLDGPVMQLHQTQLGHLNADELAELSRLLFKARHEVSRNGADEPTGGARRRQETGASADGE